VNTPRIFTRRSLLISAVLTAVVLSVFYPVAGLDFVHYDDYVYILENFHVRTGLLLSNVSWAFTNVHSANWHPLTWISHMADVELYGLAPAGHHLSGLGFHVLNTLLLFLVFRSMTGATWRSAGVAALFGVHPLHVESVAWVSERKDVLCALFWFLSLGAYLRYLRRPDRGRFLPVVVIYGLGLLAKPMLVTFPVLLLLLDYWPLGRFRPAAPAAAISGGRANPVALRFLVLEKAPLFLLAAAASAITFVAQRTAGSMQMMGKISLSARLQNAVVSYVEYLKKTILPLDLTAVYPHPGNGIHLGKTAGAVFILAAISLAAVHWRRRSPFLLVGWAWFIGTLVPVIGIVQVGPQAMADRYTYIPLVGLFVSLLWSADQLTAGSPRRGWQAGVGLAAVLSCLMISARTHIGFWRNSHTLFEHALEVVPDNWAAHNYLGVVLEKEGNYQGAIAEFSQAVRIKPDYLESSINRGLVLAKLNLPDEAMKSFRQALHYNPDSADILNNIGYLMFRQGNADEAIATLREALRHDPEHAPTHYNLGAILAAGGKTAEASEQFKTVVRITPEFPEAHLSLGLLLMKTGSRSEAAFHFREALRYNPGEQRAKDGLNAVLGRTGE